MTSSWIYEDESYDYLSGLIGSPDIGLSDMARLRAIANGDHIDILRSNAFALFAGGDRGGRHVESGMAIADNLKLFLVGAPENVFHYMDRWTWTRDVYDLIAKLRG